MRWLADLLWRVLTRWLPAESVIVGQAEVAMAALTPDDPDLPKEGR